MFSMLNLYVNVLPYEFIFAKDNKSDASFYIITVNVVRSKLSLTDSRLGKT